MEVVIMVYAVDMEKMIAVGGDANAGIAVTVGGVVLICFWLYFIYGGRHKGNEESSQRGPMYVGFVNQRSGEQKIIKVGFSWVLFFFAGVLGIPLFLRRLYVWGGVFLVLWILYIFGPQMLPDTAHSAGTYLFLCLVFFALQIWIG